jgi:hypothetical protein
LRKRDPKQEASSSDSRDRGFHYTAEID